MSCFPSLAATANAANLSRYAVQLSIIAGNEWWNLPTSRAVFYTEEWFREIERPYDTIFNARGVPDFYSPGGWIEAKSTIREAYNEVLSAQANLEKPVSGGTVLVSRENLGAAFHKLSNTANRLKPLSETTYLNQFYGLQLFKASTFIPTLAWFFEGADLYYISRTDTETLGILQDSLHLAAMEIREISEMLLSGCYQPPPEEEEDDNCDRIADALEAIAAKDFTCPEPDLTPVIEAVEKLSGAIGVADLDEGIKLPKLITRPPDDNVGKDSDYITVNSIPEFLAWNFRQLDALFGRFPITIIQEDAGITEEGDQENKIVIPNLSEGIAELIALNAVQLTSSDAILKSNISTLGEVITAKKILVQAKFILDNLQEFAGMGIKQKTIKMPVSANMLKTKLAEALEPTEIDVIVDDYVLNTDGSEFDVDRIGKIVNTIYAIVSAAFVYRIDKDAPEESIRSDLMKIRDGLALVDSEDEDTFSQFIERAETAFSDAPGSMDNATPTPYGRDRDRRPLIRRTEGMGDDDIKDGDTDQP